MAYYARVYYPADDAGDTVFAVPFQYLRQTHVTVYHKTSEENLYTETYTEGVDYTWTSAAEITLAAPRDATTDILIRRETPVTVLSLLQAGVISSSKLNLNAIQRQYVDEELYDEMQGVLSSVSAFSSRLSVVEQLVGAGISSLAIPASEELLAGDFVNVHYSSGARLRQATASDPLRWATGFVTADTALGEAAVLNLTGLNEAVSPGTLSEVFLSGTTAGGYSASPPSTEGSIVQPLGLAIPGKGVLFTPQRRIIL